MTDKRGRRTEVGQNMLPAYQTVTSLVIEDIKEFSRHSKTLVKFNNNRSKQVDKNIQEAVDYFRPGFEVFVKTYHETYDNYNEYFMCRSNTINYVKGFDGSDRQFFAQLKQLDETMDLLRKSIQSINDPDKISADINAVRAYIESFRAFLDIQGGKPIAEIPASIVTGLNERLNNRGVDWLRISENAQRWAEYISRAIDRLFL